MDDSDFDLLPSATGILHCLRALAREAATLKLRRTLSAIEDALDVASFEAGADATGDDLRGTCARPILH